MKNLIRRLSAYSVVAIIIGLVTLLIFTDEHAKSAGTDSNIDQFAQFESTPVPTAPVCGGSIGYNSERQKESIPWRGGKCVYQFAGTVDDVVTILMKKTDTSLDPFLELRDSNQNLIASSDDDGGNSDSLIHQFKLPNTGVYYIIAKSYNDESAGTFEMLLSVSTVLLSPTSTPTLTPAPTSTPPACGGSLSYGGSRRERIPWRGGQCVYQFSGQVGDVIVLSENAVDTSLDPFLELRDSNQNLIASSDDEGGNGNSLINRFKLPKTGIYYIVARSYNDEGAGAFEISLSLSARPTTPVTPPSQSIALVTIANLNVRSGPGTTFSVIGKVQQGQRLPVLSRNQAGGWVQVRTTIGIGWVSERYVQIVEQKSQPLSNLQADSQTFQTLINNLNTAAQANDTETVVTTLETVLTIANPTLSVAADTWNSLCWWGSLYGFAAQVVNDACEEAVSVATEGDKAGVHDSRGLARILTGNINGAIADFEIFVAWTKSNGVYEQYGRTRTIWIQRLRNGEDPVVVFNEETLETLKRE